MLTKLALFAVVVGSLVLASLGFRKAPYVPGKLRANGLVTTKHGPAKIGTTELAAFSAGCFWGVEEQFREQKGVVATAAGFCGGHVAHPSYERVCQGDTGHAETVEVEYDPNVVSYGQLLDLFWSIHDPTTLNRQGPDYGEQYRSVIFTFTPKQQKEAIASRDKLQRSGELDGKIVTEIVPAQPFYKAEEYHQQYVEKGGIAFCHIRKPIRH